MRMNITWARVVAGSLLALTLHTAHAADYPAPVDGTTGNAVFWKQQLQDWLPTVRSATP